MARPSIYEAAGGESAFLALAAAHHQRCLDDPMLNHPFSHPGHPQHVERLAAYWAEALGGPPGPVGHSGMLGIHAGNGAPPEMGQRFLACFLAAIDDAGLPDDPELRRALHDYMAWAVAEVDGCWDREPDEFAADLPMPRWSWDGPVTGGT
jgi:hemoglobin